MSHMSDRNDFTLVLRPPGALEKVEPGAKRILSGMVADTLALARDAALAQVDLDALVREGKRLYCRMMKGRGLRAGELTPEDIQSFNFRLASGLSQRQGVREEDIQAFALFYRAAKAGHAEAQFIVSRCYTWGHGVQRDEAQVLNWLRKSAESGFAEAQNDLGDCYLSGDGMTQDYAAAVKWYRKAAEQNNAPAQYNLGGCYFVGHGVIWDYEEAVKWYRKAADQDYALAQCSLGVCYGFGKGVTQDSTESAEWFRKAAEQEDAPAQFNLGYCYEHGQGVPQDYTKAVQWYRKAADQGHTRAQEFLGACYANGRAAIDVEDAVEVFKWVKLAEEHGCEGAAKTAAVIEALLSPEEFREAERRYRELMASR
jgi:TPR repeat protein